MKKNIAIFGASSGLGFSISQTLANKFTIGCFSRNVENHPKDIKHSFKVDIKDDKALNKQINNFIESVGKIDGFIYCSGVQMVKPLRITKDEEILDLFNTNTFGAFRVAKLFLSNKYSSSDSKFIAISSIASIKPDKGIIPYSASKSALDNMITGLAIEGAPREAFSIAPGWIKTPMTDNLKSIYNQEFIDDLENRSPTGLIKISDLIDFLLSGKAKSMTGQRMVVDGGITLV